MNLKDIKPVELAGESGGLHEYLGLEIEHVEALLSKAEKISDKIVEEKGVLQFSDIITSFVEVASTPNEMAFLLINLGMIQSELTEEEK